MALQIQQARKGSHEGLRKNGVQFLDVSPNSRSFSSRKKCSELSNRYFPLLKRLGFIPFISRI